MEIVNTLYQIGLPTFAGIFIFLAYLRPTIRLLNRTIHRRFKITRIVRATWMVLTFLSYGQSRKELYRAACMRVEAELLHPRPERPDRWEYRHRSDFRSDLREYRKSLRHWHENIGLMTDNLMKKSDKNKMVVATCFAISEVQEEILRYFRVRLAENAKVDANPEVFMSEVHVQEAFVAPLQLLSGLLGKYDEDWPQLIEGHRATVEELDDSLGDIRSFQAFLFTCWLTWGPSIPFGTCKRWGGHNVMQLGYGDESNSIALAVRSADEPPPPRTARGGHVVLAEGLQVTGVIKTAAAVDHLHLCSAQTEVLRTGQNQLVLETSAPVTAPSEAESIYYSAYIWVIVVLCGTNGRPKHGEPWKNMLTFFEHGNVADDSTYLMLKRQLAAKVRTSLESILHEHPDLILSFACAIDECGCGEPIRYPAPPGESMRELLFAESWLARLDAKGWRDRMRTALPGKARVAHAACKLPNTVSAYQRDQLRRTKSTPIDRQLPEVLVG